MSAMTNGHDLLDFRLHDIRQPTLVVWGAEDELIPLSVGEKIHEGIPDSSLAVIDECGHLAPLECSEPVTEATEKFLHAQQPVQASESVSASH
jgi:pimeloyl-ACP methyl ester carboxylesterase